MNLAKRLTLCVLIAILLPGAALAQDFAPPVEDPQAEEPQPEEPSEQAEPEPTPMRTAMDRIADLRERLADLDASDAMAYIELGEEVASETGSPEDRDLARHLYAVAYDLERETRARPEVIAGACLGLASLEVSDEGSAWLYAVAGLVDPRATRGEGAGVTTLAIAPDVAVAAANALGLARSGEGRRAGRIYEDPAVHQVFDRYGRLLGGTGGLSGLNRFERALRDWPDLECGGSRVITRRGEDGIETHLCPSCRGNPGPPMSEQEFLNQLRFESRLLRGIHQSWGAQIAADGGAPLLDPDPDRVPELLIARYGTDTAKRLWRGGVWFEPPASPAPTQDPPAEEPTPGP
ncbi:MAG: hypothetical protein NCW75_10515 [Phycisphaera sp.]|nr:MAG: hypothetical protein NCW75_10515 [Phycisphaera sp.]